MEVYSLLRVEVNILHTQFGPVSARPVHISAEKHSCEDDLDLVSHSSTHFTDHRAITEKLSTEGSRVSGVLMA